MNKGFKALPENVQRKIDPEMAKKYMGGGVVMDRPLFRQMGGPAAPMPQDMMPPQGMMPPMSPEEEVIDAEQSAEMAGREFVANMMGNIDAAEDVTSMINALRGNDAPLESRYSELAGYVGEADASQTPESVLAMVQPAIMLTEEGAIDSGIGELMSKMAGSEMETPDGSPTPMGQGVGELMAMGAGSTPPVNFRNGGPVEVRRFANGTPPTGNLSVISEAQRMAPAYQKLFAGAMDSEARAADLEEQKRLSQAQILFDIAQTALAAGAPTATPMSAAERIAGAVGQTQLFDKVGQRSAGLLQAKQAQAAEDRQLRMAGLQAGLSQAQAEEKFRQDMQLAGAKKTAPDMKTIYTVDADGNPKIYDQFNMKNDDDIARYKAFIDPDNQEKLDFEIYNDETIKPFIKAKEARLTGDIEGEKTLPTEFIVKQPFSVTRNGVTVEFKTGELAYVTQNELDRHANSLGSISSGTERVTLYPIDGIGKPVAYLKSSTQIAALTGPNGGYTTDPAAYVSRLDEAKQERKEDRTFASQTFYSIDSTGKTIRKTINTSGEQGKKDAEALLALGYTTDSSEANAVLADAFAQKQQERGFNAVQFYKKNADGSFDRTVVNVVTAEGRNKASDLFKDGYTTDNAEANKALDEIYGIRKEKRTEMQTIQAEIRAQTFLKMAENRAEDRTLSKEERDAAALLAKEERAKIALIEAENRAEDRTLSAEDRAVARKKAEEYRGELIAVRSDIRQTKFDIAKEKRALETAVAKEGRDAVAPFTRAIGDKLFRIDLSKPEDDQITLLIDESTIPDVFGSGTTGKVMSIVSNEDLLSKYANNTLSKEADGISPTDMEAALIAYNSPTSTAYSADAKDMVTTPGKALTSTMIDALRTRKLNGLSVPTGVYFPQDALDAAVDERLGIQNGLDQAPPMTEFLGEAAWGSKAFVQNLTNNLLEFAQAPAYFTEAKDAIEAVKNLNQEFETVFLASQEIRDSVYQGKKLEDLTPKPAKFFGTGPDAARSKALNLYERLKRHIQITEAQLNDPNIPMPQTGPGSLQKKQERLQTLKDLQAGYGVLAGLDLLSRGMDPADVDRSEAEQALIDELDRLSGISGGDENDPDE